jgi:hypothetical protein
LTDRQKKIITVLNMKTDVQIKDEPMEIPVKIFFTKKYSENISFA